MKNIKKTVAFIAILAMALLCISCGNTNTTSTPTATATATEAPSTTGVRKIIMATNAYFPPYEYYEGTDMVGIDVEIAKAIAEKLGYELVIEDIAFEAIINEVVSGKADFGMAGITVDEKRLESVDFTTSYASGVQVVIVKEDSPIQTVDDIGAEGKNYKVGVQLATTSDSYASSDYEGNVVQYANGMEALQALIKGDVDCVLIDNEPAKALVAANAGTKILDTTYADEDYAICVNKNNKTLLNELNQAIYDLTEDGTIADIINKYIK